jgi:hypothetical protein
MAPVKATAVGITPQTTDDAELVKLLQELNGFRIKTDNDVSTDEINRLVAHVHKYPQWKFEEQVSVMLYVECILVCRPCSNVGAFRWTCTNGFQLSTRLTRR